MIFITVLLLVLFASQYLTQRPRALYYHSRRINDLYRIRRGMVSNSEIVELSHRFYTEEWYMVLTGLTRQYLSMRFYMSSTGRLYQKRLIGERISAAFVSRTEAVRSIQGLLTGECDPIVVDITDQADMASFYPAMAI